LREGALDDAFGMIVATGDKARRPRARAAGKLERFSSGPLDLSVRTRHCGA